MSQPEWTFLRFVNRVLRNLRKPIISDINDSANSRIAKDVIEVTREEYQEICSRQDWHWLRKEAHIVTRAEVDTTADATNGSGVLSTVASFPSWAQFRTGSDELGRIKVQSKTNDEIYVVQENSSALGLTLDRIYTGATDSSLGIYIFKDAYALEEDFGRFLSVHKYFGDSEIRLVGIQEFKERQFETTQYGITRLGTNYGPQWATLTDTQEVRFWPWPAEQRSYSYEYIKVPEELNGNEAQFEIPQDDMTVLLHRVMMIMYGYIEDDTRSNIAAQLFAEKYAEMSGSKTNVDDSTEIFMINRDRARHRRSRRGAYGSIDWGKTFDRWP